MAAARGELQNMKIRHPCDACVHAWLRCMQSIERVESNGSLTEEQTNHGVGLKSFFAQRNR